MRIEHVIGFENFTQRLNDQQHKGDDNHPFDQITVCQAAGVTGYLVLQIALHHHIPCIVDDQQREGNHQKEHRKDLYQRPALLGVALIEDIDPHMFVVFERVGDPQQEDYIVEVPLYLLQGNRTG